MDDPGVVPGGGVVPVVFVGVIPPSCPVVLKPVPAPVVLVSTNVPVPGVVPNVVAAETDIVVKNISIYTRVNNFLFIFLFVCVYDIQYVF